MKRASRRRGGAAGRGRARRAAPEPARSAGAVTDREWKALGAIDFHAHMGRLRHNEAGLTPRDLVKLMDRNGIAKAVVLPIENPEELDYYVTTEQVLDAAARHPGRLVPFCNVDPRHRYPGQFDPLPVIKDYVARGCRGFGEVLAGVPIDSPLTDGLYSACGETGLPVVLHLDHWINRDSLGLKGLERVLKRHRRTVFVGHGQSFWREISAKVRRSDVYPVGRVVPGGRADGLLGDYANMYADLSAHSGYNALSRDPEFGYDFLERRRAKLLFGTDCLRRGQELPIVEFLRRAPVRGSTRLMIARTNAEKLLGL